MIYCAWIEKMKQITLLEHLAVISNLQYSYLLSCPLFPALSTGIFFLWFLHLVLVIVKVIVSAQLDTQGHKQHLQYHVFAMLTFSQHSICAAVLFVIPPSLIQSLFWFALLWNHLWLAEFTANQQWHQQQRWTKWWLTLDPCTGESL